MGTLMRAAVKADKFLNRLLLIALVVLGLVYMTKPSNAQGYGCGRDAYSGQWVCGQVQPTCEQQPRPGCPNWGYGYGGGYYQQQPQRQCWWEIDWRGKRVRVCNF